MSQESLEEEIFAWIVKHTGDESLRSQCKSTNLSSREFTGVGCFVNLESDRSLPASTLRMSDVSLHIRSNELPLGGGAILFLKDGWLDFLEIYVNGSDAYPDDISHFELFRNAT